MIACQEATFGTHPFESRKSDAVEMDEMMAAMVLTSLSCSPVVQSPPGADANFSGEEGGLCGFWVQQRLRADPLCFEQLIATVTSLPTGSLESLLTCTSDG